jgi:hypothetical protein
MADRVLVSICCNADQLHIVTEQLDKIDFKYTTKLDPWAATRAYKHRKYHQDPEFREQTLKTCAERNKKKYAEDSEYRLKLQLQRRQRYQLQKLKTAAAVNS